MLRVGAPRPARPVWDNSVQGTAIPGRVPPLVAFSFAIFLILGIIIGHSHVLAAGIGAAPLSTLGVGARELALGGAGTALAGGASGFTYNPAAPADIRQSLLFAQRSVPVEGALFNAVAYTGEAGRSGVITTGLRRLSSGDIPRTDAEGNVIGAFDYSETIASLNWARRLSPQIAAGAQLKLASILVANEGASGYALDIGARVQASELPLIIGAAVQNAASSQVEWTTGATDAWIPNVRLGAAWGFHIASAPVWAALDWSSLDGLAIGVEVSPSASWSLRTGWKAVDGSSSYAIGLGYRLGSVVLDYAFVAEDRSGVGVPAALGDAHHVSLIIAL